MEVISSDDDAIVLRVQGGDRGAYIALFDKYYGAIYRYTRWQLRDPDTASDIASETFARALKAVGSFRTGENRPYIAYLMTICRRLVSTERSRKRAHASCSLHDPVVSSAELMDPRPGPVERVLDREREEIVRNAIERLVPDDREIILLAFERDLSRRDIALLLGKPTTTAVSSHLHRAMTKLRTLVAEQGYFGAPVEAQRT